MNPFALLVRLAPAISSRWRNVWFRLLGVRLRGYVWLRRISIPRNWSDITIESNTSLDDGVFLLCSGAPKSDRLIIRSGTYINRLTMIDAHERIEIGRDCMIGPNCYITDGDHGTAQGTAIRNQPMITKPVVIGDGAWLGAGVIVLKGVSIGKNAVIGAGAVVTNDVPEDAIAVGVPTRIVGSRKQPRQ